MIALVITIIVLLILAGVSIAMLTGENGILNQAKNAKKQTEQAAENEEGILNDYETKINEIATGKEEAKPGKYYETNTDVQIGGELLTIPGGASLSKIEGEYEDVDQGIVIYITNKQITDEEWQDVETMQTTYDQFVWVPVESFDKFIRYDFGKQGINQEDFIDTELVEEKYYEAVGNGTSNGTEVEKMYKSVKENKGFYIGRYEAGNDGNGNAISKRYANVYNSIKWGNSMTDETGGAVEKARNFSIKNGYTNLTSTLVYGVQWDAVMRWISNGKTEERNWLTDSTGKGNYFDNDDSNNPNKTGINDKYQMKNIYDLAGNVHEWTMEAKGKEKRVARGGYYGGNGNIDPCSCRYALDYKYNDESSGFRISLYI